MLIDTHVLLWAASRPELLSKKAQAQLSQSVRLVVSISSLLEIAIKERIGKLQGYVFAQDWIAQENLTVLPLSDSHLRTYLTLGGAENKDPYDLLLVSVALSEHLPLLTADDKILTMRLPGLELIDARK